MRRPKDSKLIPTRLVGQDIVTFSGCFRLIKRTVHLQGHRMILSHRSSSETADFISEVPRRNIPQDCISHSSTDKLATFFPTLTRSFVACAYFPELHAVYKYFSASQSVNLRAVAATFNSDALVNTRMVNDIFHPFPRLPLELREEIWRLCPPHRVHRVQEIDDPNARIVWEICGLEEDKISCGFYPTSRSNDRPPLLTRVCHESHSVACRTGEWIPILFGVTTSAVLRFPVKLIGRPAKLSTTDTGMSLRGTLHI